MAQYIEHIENIQTPRGYMSQVDPHKGGRTVKADPRKGGRTVQVDPQKGGRTVQVDPQKRWTHCPGRP